jgi:hypothetical protein
MSKQNKGQNNHGSNGGVKVKRAKTPAQIAKKARNEADAAARLLVLQKEQQEFAKVREDHGNLSDEQCRSLLAEAAARRELEMLLACDMVVGGDPFSKRLMRFLGKDTLKGVALGNVAVRDIIVACWTYARTQDAMLRPTE